MKTPRRAKRRVALMLELHWPYRRHLDVFLGTQRYAQQRGDWECFVDEFADRHLGPPEARRYDGIIARAGSLTARRARRARVPVVNVWHNSPAKGLAGVYPDFVRSGALAAAHLRERGLRRFACLMVPSNKTHAALHQGFQAALARAGYDCVVNAAPSDQQEGSERIWERFQHALERWIASWQPPIGVLVGFNDFTARYLADTCRRLGRRVPEDVALVVADNDLPICLQPPPSLTGIDLGYERVGYEAARLLERLMRGRHAPAAPVAVPPAGIVARQSTDFFAAEDELVVAAMRFIAAHLAEPIGVDDVALAVHASRRTLERRFQATAGRSVFAEIRRLRLQRAQRMLLDTDLPIKQIAHASGFGSNMQMYQVFMRFVRVAPTTFRETKGNAL
jgi:LacI family transcriptional regulator